MCLMPWSSWPFQVSDGGIACLTESDARWRQCDVGHEDVWDAMVWGMVVTERAVDVKNVRLAPFDPTTPHANSVSPD